MSQEVFIWSHFPLTTNLASEMHDWEEFVSGEGYSVDLKSIATGETVTVRQVEEWEDRYVLISAPATGELFDRVVSKVIFALFKNTDYLKVRRASLMAPTEPTFKSTAK